MLWDSARSGSREDVGHSLGLVRECERHVNVFEEGLRGDALDASGGLDEVVAGLAGLLTTESIGKDKWFGELTGVHQKTGAVDSPLVL